MGTAARLPSDRPLRGGALAGYTVGVTADRRAAEQIELLERRGATILHGPTIRTHPLVDEGALAAATQTALSTPFDIAVLLTAIGTRGWVEAAQSLGLAETLVERLRAGDVYVRGAKAKGAASTLGLPVIWAAPSSSAELRDRLLADGVEGKRIVVQLDGAGGEPMLSDLERAGATVVGVPVYRWSFPDDLGPAARLVRATVEQRVDAITFTTRTALTHLVAIAEREGLRTPLLRALGRTTSVVCVGPVCAQRARDLGIDQLIEPTRARLGSMVYEFTARAAEARRRLKVGDHWLHIQGRLVAVDDTEPIALTERESRVLAALVTARGRVISKTELLGTVWGPGARDVHAAEVTVARLRRRLGTAGSAIETVHRRGYRLVCRDPLEAPSGM